MLFVVLHYFLSNVINFTYQQSNIHEMRVDDEKLGPLTRSLPSSFAHLTAVRPYGGTSPSLHTYTSGSCREVVVFEGTGMGKFQIQVPASCCRKVWGVSRHEVV